MFSSSDQKMQFWIVWIKMKPISTFQGVVQFPPKDHAFLNSHIVSAQWCSSLNHEQWHGAELSTHAQVTMFQWQIKLFLPLWDPLGWKVLLFCCLSQCFHCALLPLLLLDVLVLIISSDKANVKWASVLFSHQRSDSYSNWNVVLLQANLLPVC